MNQKIRIKLRSYDHNLVDKSTEKIVKTVRNSGAVVTGPIPLPVREKYLPCCVHHTSIKNLASSSNFGHIKDLLKSIRPLKKQLTLCQNWNCQAV